MNKDEEVFYRKSLQPQFQKAVIEHREKFGIPKDGFKNREQVRNWFGKAAQDDKYGDFLEYDHIFLDNGISLKHYNLLEDFILSNRRVETFGSIIPNTLCEIGEENELRYKEAGRPFVKLLIFEEASQKDVRDYVKSNWKSIVRVFEEQGVDKNRRLKATRNRVRDELIYSFSKKTRNQLEEMGAPSLPNAYKELLISKLLKKKYGYDITDEAIKKVVRRQRALRSRDT